MHADTSSARVEHSTTRTARFVRHFDGPDGFATVELEISLTVTTSQTMRSAGPVPRHASAPLDVGRLQMMPHLLAISK